MSSRFLRHLMKISELLSAVLGFNEGVVFVSVA